MFPLGRALLPNEALPLRIFEPRYLELMESLRREDRPEFGVVLISRGWETGGGEDRYDVGTVARIASDVPLGDAQRAVVAVGTTRFAVEQWLPDDPYPRAEVADWPADSTSGERLQESVAAATATMRRVYALASELGADTSRQDLTLPDDPVAAIWRIASLLPLAELDRQRLLATLEASERIALLEQLADEIAEELTLRLGSG